MSTTQPPLALSAYSRGERLYPPRSSRVYWHLTCLRKAIEAILEEFLPDRQMGVLVDYGCGNMPYRQMGVLVDYGCGNMPYRPLFEPRLSSYVGCDFPDNDRADRFLEEIAHLPIDDKAADFVLSTQVLEHVADPMLYLAECRRVLKEDGHLILSTHGVWRFHPDPYDYWRWTSEGLKKILVGSGFEVIRFRGIMGPGATALQLWQDAVSSKLHWRLSRPFTVVMQRLIKLADRRCPDSARDADACVFMTVSKKTAGH